MTILRFFFATLIFLFLYGISSGQEKAEYRFPEDWLGKWKGTMHIELMEKNKSQKIPMELHILPTENDTVWTWKIIYGKGEKQQIRDYKLIAVDTVKGRYICDEQNSIQLNFQYKMSAFYSVFSVSGNILHTTYTKQAESIAFSITVFPTEAESTTGGENEIPEVMVYPVINVQKATLYRK